MPVGAQAADHTARCRFVECLKDPKTWLFFFFAAIS